VPPFRLCGADPSAGEAHAAAWRSDDSKQKEAVLKHYAAFIGLDPVKDAVRPNRPIRLTPALAFHPQRSCTRAHAADRAPLAAVRRRVTAGPA
jgi:hypothetical protein